MCKYVCLNVLHAIYIFLKMISLIANFNQLSYMYYIYIYVYICYYSFQDRAMQPTLFSFIPIISRFLDE